MVSSESYDQLTDDESGTNLNESGTHLQCFLLITPVLDQVQDQDCVEPGVQVIRIMHICIQFAIPCASDEQTNDSDICPADDDDKTGS